MAKTDLSRVSIIYNVTRLPNLLYMGIHKANEIPEFKDFILPNTSTGIPIECRLIFIDNEKEEEVLAFDSTMLAPSPAVICSHLNHTPLRILKSISRTL